MDDYPIFLFGVVQTLKYHPHIHTIILKSFRFPNNNTPTSKIYFKFTSHTMFIFYVLHNINSIQNGWLFYFRTILYSNFLSSNKFLDMVAMLDWNKHMQPPLHLGEVQTL